MSDANNMTISPAILVQAKRERERFSVEQVQQMEQVFERTPRPSSGEKEKMAKDFNTPKRRIQVWFQNRRSKSKRQGRPSTSTSDHASSFMDNTAQSFVTPQCLFSHPDADSFSIMNPTTAVPHIRQPSRPTAFFYRPTYSFDNIFTELDSAQQHYSPTLFVHRSNQQQQQQPTRTLPPLPGSQHGPVSLYPQGTLTPFFWRSPFVDNPQTYHTTRVSSNAPFILTHETEQPRHATLTNRPRQEDN